MSLVAMGLGLGLGSIWAAKEKPEVPDLTKGGKFEDKFVQDWNLGPTGMRGQTWKWSMVTTEARQILVTEVEKGSPAGGLVEVGDVILGVGGKFTSDARVAFGNAITVAETKEAGGKLPLLLWRKGKEIGVTVPLRVMGSYGAMWPYGGCEKSAKIIELGVEHLAKHLGTSIADEVNALALLATGEKKYLPLLAALAHKVGPKDLKIDASDRGMVAWHWGYHNLFLTEYFLVTGDVEVLPAIGEFSKAIARGQSGVGTYGHGMAWPEDNGGKYHGPLGGYGALNQAGLVCQLSMVLAVKCGIKDEEVNQSIARGTRFYEFYINKGTVPYGDHNPGENHAGNGKNGIAAVMFDAVGRADGSGFFSRMVVAS